MAKNKPDKPASILKRHWHLLFLLLLVIPAIKPLFHPGFFTMHDDQQVIRLAELNDALLGGQFPVRWVSRLGFGYGYPLFVFYPPFVYYLGELYHFIGQLSYINSIKLVFTTAFVGAAFSMYAWVKHHFDKPSAIIAALFYTYAPYKAVDAYVRGALAELFSFVWLPLILLSIDQLSSLATKPKSNKSNLIKWGSLLAIFYALLMITHNLIVLPFTGIMGLYILLKLINHQNRSVFLAHCFLFLTFGLGLSTFFWLPSLAEKSQTLVDNILLSERYTYSLHYVQPSQLWNSLWGYAGSAPLGEIDGFTLKIGKLHVVLTIFSFILAVIILINKKFSNKSKSKSFFILYSSFLFLFSSLMTTKYSSFIWDSIQPMQYIQFPWRFLTFTTLFSSLLAGASVWLVQLFLKNKYLVSCFLTATAAKS